MLPIVVTFFNPLKSTETNPSQSAKKKSLIAVTFGLQDPKVNDDNLFQLLPTTWPILRVEPSLKGISLIAHSCNEFLRVTNKLASISSAKY